MSLREQIGDAILRAGTDPDAIRAAVAAVVADHVCYDRDALARALERLPSSISQMVVQYPTDDPQVWRHVPIADAIIAALEKSNKC